MASGGRFNSGREHVFVAQGKEARAYYRMRWRVRIHFAYSLQCIRRNEASPRPRSFAQISYDRTAPPPLLAPLRPSETGHPSLLSLFTRRRRGMFAIRVAIFTRSECNSGVRGKLFSRRFAGSIGIFIGFAGDQTFGRVPPERLNILVLYIMKKEECCIGGK